MQDADLYQKKEHPFGLVHRDTIHKRWAIFP